jgi:hypothetical protein
MEDKGLTIDWEELRFPPNCKTVKFEDSDCRYQQILQVYLRNRHTVILEKSPTKAQEFALVNGLGFYPADSCFKGQKCPPTKMRSPMKSNLSSFSSSLGGRQDYRQ